MKFGELPLRECEGCLLAHSLKVGSLSLRKGHLLTAGDISAIRAEGITSLIVARLEEEDVTEDVAARQLAEALASNSANQEPGIVLSEAGTGRVNFHAAANGVFCVSAKQVDAINAIDPGITVATLENFEPVLDGRMVATVKIIPYAVPGEALKEAIAIAGGEKVFEVRAYQPRKVHLISTRLPGFKESIVEKTAKVLEKRLAPSGSVLVGHDKVDHDAQKLAEILKQVPEEAGMVVVFGASAISDARDVIPEALRLAGGQVERVGMPVDPGNLLMLGSLNGIPVIGAPGCSRSPARNGFDFVLERLFAGIEVSSSDIARMGVGGLLMEIGSRPQPREIAAPSTPNVEAIILAAGQSRRMGKANKLTMELDGKALVRHVAEAVQGRVQRISVVTGHQPEEVKAVLAGIDCDFVQNPEYAAGLSTSLQAGISNIGGQASHVIVLLGDMPRIDGGMVERMLDAVGKSPPGSIIVATSNGKRGNPVIWPRAYFDALKSISGDTGARHIIGENVERVIEVELGEAASLDVDTPQAYEAINRNS